MLSKFFTLLFILLLTSCARGLIYTDIVEPKCVDMRSTPIGEKLVRGGTSKFEVPGTRVDVSMEINSRAIGDIAKKYGISTVYSERSIDFRFYS